MVPAADGKVVDRHDADERGHQQQDELGQDAHLPVHDQVADDHDHRLVEQVEGELSLGSVLERGAGVVEVLLAEHLRIPLLQADRDLRRATGQKDI